jgi:hypothetical protein
MKTEFLLQNKKLIQTILEPYHVHAKGKETIKKRSCQQNSGCVCTAVAKTTPILVEQLLYWR